MADQLPQPRIDPMIALIKLAEAGFTNKQLAEAVGLSDSQFDTFLKHNPDIWEQLDEAREVPNRRVEQSLYKRATGYLAREVHAIQGRPVRVIVKEMSPDVTACIFWLKNRDPSRWRDVIDVNLSLRDRMARAHRALKER